MDRSMDIAVDTAVLQPGGPLYLAEISNSDILYIAGIGNHDIVTNGSGI